MLACNTCLRASIFVKKPDLIPPAPEELTQTLARDLLEFVNQLFTAGHRDFFAAIEEAGVSITQVKSLRALAEADEPIVARRAV